MEENEIVYSNLGAKFGTNRCCAEVVSFNRCDCEALGVSCSGGPQDNWISAFGFSSDWIHIGVFTWAPESYAALRCAHSDDSLGCVSSAPELLPMAADCNGQLTGEARRIDDYRPDAGYCDSYNFCPDGKCKNIRGECI